MNQQKELSQSQYELVSRTSNQQEPNLPIKQQPHSLQKASEFVSTPSSKLNACYSGIVKNRAGRKESLYFQLTQMDRDTSTPQSTIIPKFITLIDV